MLEVSWLDQRDPRGFGAVVDEDEEAHCSPSSAMGGQLPLRWLKSYVAPRL